MNDILTQLNNSPVLLICLLLIIYTITAMIRRGEIGSIGKDGIKFNRNFIDSLHRLILLKRTSLSYRSI